MMNHNLVSAFRKKLEKLPVADYHGLNSPGLTCYLNSVLQVLFMTKNFRDAVKSWDSKDSPTIDSHLGKLFNDLETKMGKTRSITEELAITDIYKQRDAAEYFEKILHLTCSGASKIFKGELNHRITCCNCNKWNESRSFFWVLPLAVEDSYCKTYSVERGLKAIFSKQRIFGDDQMYCNHCDEKQEADIEWEITHHPDVLTLLLKRFAFDYKLNCYVKLHCKADVPQTLDIEKFNYDLYAVVNHFGSLTGGHYTAEIKSFENGHWYCFNDDIVKSVKQHKIRIKDSSLRSRTAYLLLYRKVSKGPANSDGTNQEAPCAHSDVKAEKRSDDVERKEPLPHYQPESGNDKGKDILKQLNNDLSRNCCEDSANSTGALEKQPNQKATWVNKFILPRSDIESNEQQRDSNTKERKCNLNNKEHLRTHRIENQFQQNNRSQKKTPKVHEIITNTATKTNQADRPERKRVKSAEIKPEKNKKTTVADARERENNQRRKTFVSDSNEKSFPIYSNSNLCRKTNSVQSNMVKRGHLVPTDNKLKKKDVVKLKKKSHGGDE